MRAQARVVLLSCILLTAPAAAGAAPAEAELAREDRMLELERKVEVLTEELARLRTETALPPEPSYTSQYGLGPAASKIYGVERGLSIGGYAEAFYRRFLGNEQPGDLDRSDFLRFVLYTGYKFTDRIVFNAEVEFEHATTSSTVSSGDGSVSVEFAALDFLWKDWANFRAGMLLVPVGFVNEQHEPPFFHGVARPEVERQIIPTTWRENGAGIFGTLGEGIAYRAYVLSGLNAEGFDAGGVRGARQKGNRSLAEDLAFVARLDYTPWPGLLLGGSLYTGDSGQNQELDGVDLPEANLTLWEVHAQYRHRGLELRGLFSMAHIGDAGELTEALRLTGDIDADETIARRMLGGYAEVAYDVMPWIDPDSAWYLAPFVRFEYYDTQYEVPSGFGGADRSKAIRLLTPGLSFKPHPNVVLKLDYRNFSPLRGERADELNLGLGLAF